MAHRDFLIRYSNGFKRHISRQERDLLSASLEQIGPREYFSKANLQASLEQTNSPAYFPGLFTIEFKQRRYSERMETPKGMVERLTNSGVLA